MAKRALGSAEDDASVSTVRDQLQPEEVITMSMMCSMNQCSREHGMCGHEKMMLVIMVMLMIGGAAYWFLA